LPDSLKDDQRTVSDKSALHDSILKLLSKDKISMKICTRLIIETHYYMFHNICIVSGSSIVTFEFSGVFPTMSCINYKHYTYCRVAMYVHT
jgi:hypothetical protein